MTSGISGLSGSSTGQPSSSVDGLVSGLNTTQIIQQLMAVEAQPENNLKQKVVNDQTAIAAYQDVNTQLLGLQTAAAAASDRATWQSMSAVSSNSAAVSATASSGATAGALTFDVTSLASAASEVSSGTVSSTSAIVSSGASITITKGGGTPVTITPTDGSLASVVSAINASNSGVSAAAVQVSPGNYKLQLTSTTTGANSAFTVNGIDQMGSFQTVSSASDAVLTIGAGTPGQYTVSSSTNTISGVMPGVTFTVLSKATGVTVSTAADPSAIASKITAMVQAANTALDTITKYASYDPGTKTAGPLLSDQTVRLLQDSILGVVSGTVAGGKTLDSVGLSLTKDGHLTFDANAFATAYKANPAQTAALFQAGGSFTATAGSSFSGTVSFESATQLTKQGAYAVHISQAATRASATIDTSAGISAGQVINLGSNGQSLSYTTDGTETVATLAQKLNALAAQNSVGIAVTVNGTQLAVQTQQYGAGFSLSASATGGLVASPVTAGQDVAGTINGVTAKGAGQLLIAPPSDPTLGGLTLNVTMTAADVAAQGAGNAGLFTYAPGAAQQYGSLAQGVTNPISGQITLAVNSLNGDINDLTQQIADWNDRLQIVQQMYQQEFSNLEVQLGQLRDQSSWLSGSLAGLGGGASMPSSPPPSSGGH